MSKENNTELQHTTEQNDLASMMDWIENIWGFYHDNASDDQILSYFNNANELSRLNKHRNEETPMKWFNLALAKALLKRNGVN